jgi:hypothetical protein
MQCVEQSLMQCPDPTPSNLVHGLLRYRNILIFVQYTDIKENKFSSYIRKFGVELLRSNI